jgi:hypothetical protein
VATDGGIGGVVDRPRAQDALGLAEQLLDLEQVAIAVGPLTLAIGVSVPRSGWLTARPPLSITGKPAVMTEPPELWDEIEALAIATMRNHPAAERHLTMHRSHRYARTSAPAGSPFVSVPIEGSTR